MKTRWKLAIPFVCIVAFLHCKSDKHTCESTKAYNGINSQILSIVDSITAHSQAKFLTIWFTMNNDNDFVVRFMNTVLIPVPPEPPSPFKEIRISEMEGFSGYKKYGSTCLVFLEDPHIDKLKKFVNKDSMIFNNMPFDSIENGSSRHLEFMKTIKNVYLIDKNDSLIFLKEE